jgi:hypothetical protein
VRILFVQYEALLRVIRERTRNLYLAILPAPMGGWGGGALHHVTLSHQRCKTVKYGVWKAQFDTDTDNFGWFIDVLKFFCLDYFVGSWKIALSTEDFSQRNLCR